jgi:hypothetical protein
LNDPGLHGLPRFRKRRPRRAARHRDVRDEKRGLGHFFNGCLSDIPNRQSLPGPLSTQAAFRRTAEGAVSRKANGNRMPALVPDSLILRARPRSRHSEAGGTELHGWPASSAWASLPMPRHMSI